MQNIDDFIGSLLTDKGITDIEPDVRKNLIEEMKSELLDQINQAAVMALSEEQAAELSRRIDDPNFTEADMTAFMEQSGVDLTQVALDTMLKFRDLYLGKEA